MQITFFVGNGFDISCGIHSSYSQFYNWYFEQEKSDLDHVNKFRETIDAEIKKGSKNWVDFEVAMGEYTKHFTTATVEKYIDCYDDARDRLIEYLGQEMEQFEEPILNNAESQKLRKSLKKFYADLSPKEQQTIEQMFIDARDGDSQISFVSYNYTNALDRCISQITGEPLESWVSTSGHRHALTIDPRIIHAHGTLERYPVFGVNDESQISNRSLLTVPDFANIMIKPKCVDELGELWHEETNRVIENSSIICIFGMSLGITDTIWFEKIMAWLKEKDNRQLVVFWYTNTPSDNRKNTRLFINRRKIRNMMIDYSDYTNAQIESISQRIHVVENTESVLRVKLNKKMVK